MWYFVFIFKSNLYPQSETQTPDLEIESLMLHGLSQPGAPVIF